MDEAVKKVIIFKYVVVTCKNIGGQTNQSIFFIQIAIHFIYLTLPLYHILLHLKYFKLLGCTTQQNLFYTPHHFCMQYKVNL